MPLALAWLTSSEVSSPPGNAMITSGRLSAKIVANATLKVYPGAPHGLTVTHADQFNQDLLAFAKA